MRAAVMVLALLVPFAARADDALDKQIDSLVAAPGDPVDLGVWFGPAGAPISQRGATRAMPAASVVKTALLIELFAAHAGHLDEPLGADALLADDKHPGIAPFAAAQRRELRAVLRGATVRTVGAIMMGSKPASNAVYNAAANLVIASLGGAAEATAKIHARDPAFAGIAVRRYMLASRTASGDNEATPAALAAVLAAIATAKLTGIDDRGLPPRGSAAEGRRGLIDAATVEAIAAAMMLARDPKLGAYRHKDGNLDSDPMVCIKTGFYPRGQGQPPLVFVVGAALSAKPAGDRDAAQRRLDKLADAVLAVLRAATPK